MSWFRELEELTPLHEGADGELHREGESVEPGVCVARRGFLALSALGVGGAMLGGEARAAGVKPRATQDPEQPITLERFMDLAGPMLSRLWDSKQRNEEAYVYRLVALLTWLAKHPADPFTAADDLALGWGTKRSSIRMPKRRQVPMVVAYQLKFEAGARIPHHDHRDGNGVILMLDGSLRCRNFDIVEGSSATRDLKLRETVDATLAPGRYSTLTSTRDNVHDLVAGRGGARILDVFTYFDNKPPSHPLAVNEKPLDASGKLFAARWKSDKPGNDK